MSKSLRKNLIWIAGGGAVLAALLVTYAAFPTLFRLRDMDGLGHDILANWIENSGWKRGSRDDFIKSFGKPDLMDDDTSPNFHLLLYQCGDGILAVAALKVSESTGRTDNLEITNLYQVKGGLIKGGKVLRGQVPHP